MKRLLKVNLFAVMLWAIELIALVVWFSIDVQKQGNMQSQTQDFGLLLIVLFLVTSVVFIITFMILLAWTVRIYYKESRLKYLFREYLLLVAGMMLVGLAIKLLINKDMDPRLFTFQVLVFPWFFLMGRVSECVKTHSDDMVIRRK